MTELKRILVVDDDDFILNLLERRLTEDNGYIFSYAHHGRDALIMTQKQEYDIILTDIVMPIKDGLTFISELRKFNESTPVIAMSGGPHGEKAAEFLEFSGKSANETLQKPFSSKELFQVINIAMASKKPDLLQAH